MCGGYIAVSLDVQQSICAVFGLEFKQEVLEDRFFFARLKKVKLCSLALNIRKRKHNISLQVPELIPVSKPKTLRVIWFTSYFRVSHQKYNWICILTTQKHGQHPRYCFSLEPMQRQCFTLFTVGVLLSGLPEEVSIPPEAEAHVAPVSKSPHWLKAVYALEFILTYIK